MASIFTRIINGEIPCYKIYENEYTFAFLDINPINPGHTLIVPKIETDHFLDVPEPYYSAVFTTAKNIGRAIQEATESKRIGSVILGWDVPHFHLHLVPMNTPGDLDFSRAKGRSKEEMEEIREKILAKLKGSI